MVVELKSMDRQRHDMSEKLKGTNFDLSMANESLAISNKKMLQTD